MLNKTDKAVTITTIAKELGLSVSAVSYVLNVTSKRHKVSDQTAKRIHEVANRLGYIPNVLAQSLRKQRSGVIGVVFGTLTQDWAELALIGMRGVLDASGYLPFLSVSHWDPQIEEQVFLTLRQRQVEGIICVPNPASHRLYEQTIRQGLPLVFLNDTLLNLPTASHIAWDAGQATRVAMNHLIENGYRRIGFLGSDHKTVMTRARYRAYVQCLKKAGLPLNEAWIAWETVSPVSPHPADPVQIVGHMLQKAYFDANPRPDALYTTVDGVALAVLRVMYDRGVRVPEDVALISMGDLPGAKLPGVGLTTMHEPVEELGYQAAKAILELIQNPARDPIQIHLVRNDLQVRTTTRRLSA